MTLIKYGGGCMKKIITLSVLFLVFSVYSSEISPFSKQVAYNSMEQATTSNEGSRIEIRRAMVAFHPNIIQLEKELALHSEKTWRWNYQTTTEVNNFIIDLGAIRERMSVINVDGDEDLFDTKWKSENRALNRVFSGLIQMVDSHSELMTLIISLEDKLKSLNLKYNDIILIDKLNTLINEIQNGSSAHAQQRNGQTSNSTISADVHNLEVANAKLLEQLEYVHNVSSRFSTLLTEIDTSDTAEVNLEIISRVDRLKSLIMAHVKSTKSMMNEVDSRDQTVNTNFERETERVEAFRFPRKWCLCTML